MNPRWVAPQCPYCGNIAPHGDARIQWFSTHLDSRTHRVWWWIRRKFRKRKK